MGHSFIHVIGIADMNYGNLQSLYILSPLEFYCFMNKIDIFWVELSVLCNSYVKYMCFFRYIVNAIMFITSSVDRLNKYLE